MSAADSHSSSSSSPQHLCPQNPQSGSSSSSPKNSTAGNGTSTSTSPAPSSPKKGSHRRDLPPLFWYMEMGDWDKATARAKSHPKEVKTRATLRTKSMADDGTKVSGTKRLALHHACFKLRSAGSAPTSTSTAISSADQDPFLAVCKFILLLLEIYPEACQVRESRHGCLPLHLAAFASCYVRPPSTDDDNNDHFHPQKHQQLAMSKTSSSHIGESCRTRPPAHFRPSSSSTMSGCSSAILEKPGILSVRSTSESTTSTTHSNMTAILMEESFAAAQTQRKKEGGNAPPPLTRHAGAQPQADSPFPTTAAPATTTVTPAPTSTPQTIFISNKREQMSVQVLNAMLDAHPRAIRLDSEGGRLPLHTACAGRATPRCVSLLLRAYPAASRHRNKDGFLPLHLAAHWGVSHPNVAITLLKAYPDATVGRNRWERTPLEEALVMAGENGRPHQASLVRALRKHPSYWTQPPKELFQQQQQQMLEERQSNLVDMDITLASNDDDATSVDDNPNYFNAGHTCLMEDEYEKFNVPEGEEACLEYSQQGGIMSRLRRKSSIRNEVAQEDIIQDLPTLIKNLKWKSVIALLECNPDEANQELVGIMTRGGFASGTNMKPLHYACERKPPMEVVEALIEANPEAITERMMPGGALPLHIACTWQSSPNVVSALLAADPTTAKVVDELGNRPLHASCFSGADISVVHDLLATYPKAVLCRNNQGSQPIDICRRLKHHNRRTVMTALLDKKEYIIAKQKHRRSKSSGSMGALAQTAVNLNDKFGSPLIKNLLGQHQQPQQQRVGSNNNHNKPEGVPSVGVEVTYRQDQDNSQALLWI